MKAISSASYLERDVKSLRKAEMEVQENFKGNNVKPAEWYVYRHYIYIYVIEYVNAAFTDTIRRKKERKNTFLNSFMKGSNPILEKILDNSIL